MNLTHPPTRILNVNDNATSRKAVSSILTRAGFAITEAESPAKTLREVKKALPDLVLLSTTMPGADSHDICAQIRQCPGAMHLPVVFLSEGRAHHRHALEEPGNGEDARIAWPASPEVLAATIKSVLRLRRAEAQLRESEERFRNTFEQAAVGLGHMTLDGRWTWINSRLCQIFGCSHEEMVQRGSLDIACPDYRQTLAEHRGRVAAGKVGSFALELPCCRKDGSIVWTSWTVSLARDGAGQPEHLVAVVDDISVRKWTEENLLRIRAGIEGSSDAIAIADPQGRHVYHNRAFSRMFGYLAEELPAPLAPGALYADVEVGQMVFDTIRRGLSWHSEVEMAAKDGRRFPVELRADAILDERDELVGLIGVHSDITERKASERRLRQLSRAMEQTASTVVITDLQGRIEYANPRFVETTGYTLEEALGQNPRILKSGSTPAATYEELWRTILAGQTWRGEFHNQKKTGEFYWESATISPVTDEHGVASHFIAVKEDITERKQLEAQLRQAQRMEAIGQLAGGVAHDFNNLLAVIRGNAELLTMGASKLDAQANDCLKHVICASESAANLTRQLLVFSRKQAMQAQPVALNDLIRNLAKMLRRTIREDIEFHCEYDEPLLPVKADPGMLEQVLLNLVVNARDAMPRGGRLEVGTEMVRLDAAAALANPDARPGDFACLHVTDTGTGIPPEHLPRIFEPFFTTKEPGRGTGLGLATVYGIVKQHQGWVEVLSRVGTGTTFKIFLPAIRLPAKTAEAAAEEKPRGGTETILLVEDDYSVRMITQRMLETFNYKVVVATCSREALEAWSRLADRIDLLLADIVLPDGLSGRELAEQLRAEKPGLKTVFMSGYSQEIMNGETEFMQRAKARFIRKPFSTSTLVRTVRQCLDEKGA